MSNDFEFRLWDARNKQMNYDALHLYSDNRRMHFDHAIYDYDHSIANGLIWMMWTGLFDIHSKQIFNGDIIQSNDGVIRVITWRKGAFHCDHPNYTDKSGLPTHPVYFWALTVDNKWKVIGNVHQNPELLTQTPTPPPDLKEKDLIAKIMKKCEGKGQFKNAAFELGISERTLYRKIKEYDIKY